MSANSVSKSPAAPELVSGFRNGLKDKRRGALIDAYLKKPSADAMSAKALELLMEDVDAIDKT